MDVKNRDESESSARAAEGVRKKGERKTRTAALLKEVFFGGMYALWGYFLGGAALPFGAMPFGVAFLSAADRRVFYIYGGLCLSAWGREDSALLIGVYTALVCLRLLVCFILDPPWKKEEAAEIGERTVAQIYPSLFSEHVALRMSSSAVAAFTIGLYHMIKGGMLFYDLYGTIIATLSAPLSVLLVSGFFIKDSNKYRRLVSFLALSFALVWVTKDIKLYGIALGAAGCMFVTLFITRKGGTLLGIISGALLGLALSVELVPLFAFTALASGLLFNMSAALAITGGLSVAIAWGVYVQGIGILSGLASALVSSALAYSVCDKLFISEKRVRSRSSSDAVAAREIDILAHKKRELDRARLCDVENRISAAKESFETMSEVLKGISKSLQTPSAADLKQICDNAFDSSCASCENRQGCWGDRYRETSDALLELCGILQRKGSVSLEEAHDRLISDCPRLYDILSEINHNAYLHTREIVEGDRTEVFALDYSAVAEFMDTALFDEREEYETDGALSGALMTQLSEADLEINAVCVWGKRQRRVVIFFDDRDRLCADRERIKDQLSEYCPFDLDDGALDDTEGILRFAEKEGFSVSCAQRSLFAEGEEKYCGDTSGVFRTHDGRWYSFISDGMGSGRQAALTSGIVGLFLRKFLAGGCPCEGTLRLLNGFLRNRGGGSLAECSATVDLLELDLFKGDARFYKSGAAPTYVFRNGSLFKIRSHTVPVGIIRELDSRKIEMQMSKGDVVIMVSDGVTDGKEECPWLFDLLRSQGENATPERLCDLIVKYAKAEGATDDVSVMVMRIN